MIKRKYFIKLFTFFMMIELIFYFLNIDMYLQVSGMYIFLLIALFFSIFSIDLRKTLNKYQVIIILFIFSIVLSILTNFTSNESGYVLSYIILSSLTFIFASINLEDKQMKLINIGFIIYSIIISSCIILFQQRFYAEEANRLTVKFGTNPFIDPNYLAASLVAPFFLCCMFFKKEKNKILYAILSVIIVVAILLTGSRGALVSLVLSVIFVNIDKIIKKITLKRIIIFIMALALLILSLVLFLPDAFINRFFDFDTWLDVSNFRRLRLWGNAIEMIGKRPILGYGLANTATIIGSSAHSTFLELFVHFGIIGGVVIIVLLILIYFNLNDKYMRGILLSTIIWSIFISAEMTLFFWLNICICINSCRLRKDYLLNEVNKCYNTSI